MKQSMIWLRALALSCALALSACAVLVPEDSPVVRVAGLRPLPGSGLELRFMLELRVQNPREQPLSYDGIAVSLDLDGRGLASGVAQTRGTIERYGEGLVQVPVTVSLIGALRHALSRAGRMERGEAPDELPYTLSGKLGGTDGTPAVRFVSEGKLSLPGPLP
ncbi:MAG: LEA type 2 family protein [Burkholderiaceae bacterium]